MSARDDFGSDAGRPGGRGGSNGGLANGGVGGGRGGGGGGGGAGRNGGYGSHTGLNTGNQWHGNTAFGRPGGNVQAYGTRRPNGQMTNLKDPYGRPLNPAPTAQPPNRPAAVPGLLSPVQPPAPPQFSPPAWAPPYEQMPPMYDVTPGLPPLSPPGLSFEYNITQPPGQYPGNSWAGTGLWGINRPPAYGGGNKPQQNINSTDADGYPDLSPDGPYADGW